MSNPVFPTDAIDAAHKGAWESIATAPEREVLLTKIHDERGVRNVQALKRIGRLWWTPDGAMYVYYTPTHWQRSP